MIIRSGTELIPYRYWSHRIEMKFGRIVSQVGLNGHGLTRRFSNVQDGGDDVISRSAAVHSLGERV